MQSTDLPTRIVLPFANNAVAGHVRPIPTASQSPTSSDAPASFYDGFRPENFQPVASGGIPVNGADMNGILNMLSAWTRWTCAGGPVFFNSAFSSYVGGYPKGARLSSTATAGVIWQSTAEANTTDPDSVSAANWVAIAAPWGSPDDQFIRYPDGKLEQWGYVAFSSNTDSVVPVTLPLQYANANYDLSLTPSINTASNIMDTWVQEIHNSLTTTGFSVQYQRSGGTGTQPGLDGFRWRTIGHSA